MSRLQHSGELAEAVVPTRPPSSSHYSIQTPSTSSIYVLVMQQPEAGSPGCRQTDLHILSCLDTQGTHRRDAAAQVSWPCVRCQSRLQVPGAGMTACQPCMQFLHDELMRMRCSHCSCKQTGGLLYAWAWHVHKCICYVEGCLEDCVHLVNLQGEQSMCAASCKLRRFLNCFNSDMSTGLTCLHI